MANHVQSYSVVEDRLSWQVAHDQDSGPEWEDEGQDDQDSRMPAYDPVYIVPHEAVKSLQAWSKTRPIDLSR